MPRFEVPVHATVLVHVTVEAPSKRAARKAARRTGAWLDWRPTTLETLEGLERVVIAKRRSRRVSPELPANPDQLTIA